MLNGELAKCGFVVHHEEFDIMENPACFKTFCRSSTHSLWWTTLEFGGDILVRLNLGIAEGTRSFE